MALNDKSVAPQQSGAPAIPGRWRLCVKLFWEYFKISIIVVGGGFAIIMVADSVFGKKLKWIKKDELLGHLPLFQTVPGLIATNSAMYVGVRVAGVAGGFAATLGAALPSFLAITIIAMGYEHFTLTNPFVKGAFIGLRASMCGIIIATIIKSWRGVMRGTYAWICMPAAVVAMLAFDVAPKYVLLTAIFCGFISAFIPVKSRS